MALNTLRLQFPGHSGATLAARLDLPNGPLRAYALFAHCFTCSKDLAGARRIAAELAREGIAVLRFDFTGLGSSEGEFASTNFSSNVADLLSAADYLRHHYEAPSLLIGHSLGGAAVLAVAGDIPEVRAVATIGAPADVGHVLKNFGTSLEEIERSGSAQVDLAGRRFVVKRQFVEDARAQRIKDSVARLKRPLLILHAPLDQTVGIENATDIFLAARHPKSFVSLDKADHLLTDPEDAAFAGRIISEWLTRYLPADTPQATKPIEHVRVRETGEGKFQNAVQAGGHRLFADEPESVGGLDSGPSPYDFLAIALGACTAMTLRLYAGHKQLKLGRIGVAVSHSKIHAKDCEECTELERSGRIDRFERVISIDGEVSEELRGKIAEIADKCPVHRTLVAVAKISTTVKPGSY
ncbi:OsmC family protein (plasmid) [Sinorhizobium meliloti]|uniref:bifunctional alpha/beta hydrolase/OsmC family protein n=1 Tax=Rhizobium meliloti TaxID=382 RepID=UPI000B5A8DFF|nr:bifunctional alpha/beta hydrolase/OsmC family protein [Sinorhizobium meliloti]ASJ62164.1 osmotically inducible protein C [Sinorhizobium meliloti]MCK3785979.1 OsmC family protein [Sinorhizobium meliloti]MCK3790887.1 OsmC family protein [Sinorhizobium meliloti]MCK3797984.1 OsmC family protein [Sinorhizobium meliloti]UTG94839.1 OsmC family protein [Sinorhizobium meliloti]